ncbi:condensation domain-containing protein [Streptomyces neyagawaensis]|uniref:condensation domain-containing protein n=1 Tax=Streptomyces neyagawaensis TaxID=42238 RepID=UPI001F0A4D85|nr:condensation domain-containing protein [Streptomyces neyagawaensis]MCL6733544.1 condensation domain-containing protein [Streptomyces neyagawaensis]MDE1685357.1 condensation domain-containing protein [Streptomyces neyagawaensis]
MSKSASFNQDKHHSSSQATRSTSDCIASSITITFEIEGRLDIAALESALLLLVRRHEVLRCEFRRLAGDLTCTALSPESVSLEAEQVGHFHTPEGLHTHLDKEFKSIDTLSWPLILMGAVVRESRSTVYLCFDHLVCDGMSMPVVVNEIQTAYAAHTAGRLPELPPTASYLTFGDAQRRRWSSLRPDDDRLDYWKGFTARNGGFFPRFPFDIGVADDRLYPMANRSRRLLDADETKALAAGARAAGGSVFTGVLAAVATALRRLGGPSVYRGLLPVSERNAEVWEHSLGWFVNTMPIEFEVGEAGVGGLAATIAGASAAYTEMQRHVDVPFVRAWELLAPEAYRLHHWPYAVNFFSYIDFRRAPGGEQHPLWKPKLHVWAACGNGISHWFHRTAAGLHVNTLHVDTPEAQQINDAQLDELVAVLREIGGAQRNS